MALRAVVKACLFCEDCLKTQKTAHHIEVSIEHGKLVYRCAVCDSKNLRF